MDTERLFSRNKLKATEISQEIKALQSLINEKGLILKLADKSGNILLMTEEKYMRMCKKIKNNHGYRKVDSSFLTIYTTKFT